MTASQVVEQTLAPAVAYQIDPVLERARRRVVDDAALEGDDLNQSDVCRANVGLERAFSRQLRGTLAYEFAYFDIEREDKTTTHTPRVGELAGHPDHHGGGKRRSDL